MIFITFNLFHIEPLRRIITFSVCTVSVLYSALHAAAVTSFDNHIAKGAIRLEKVINIIAKTTDNIEHQLKYKLDTISSSGTN
ncbi:hypothetical protein BJP34_34305 [Moorena producens PAL-8-15-08-1]|uniref:Uncharacterized protein n=1 Tax=Moorena producens PAL-8-15-08-1 TaxID=1458985 RepID=A0A1D8U1Q9_9CYAN|nr:hypothetical protein [Moorena producens]AOX03832.1 hypothetical protein BJP34_34305 [Moorena producens PAL-8-15-08-1]